MAPSQKSTTPHYHALLTPVLHKRFAEVAQYTFAACHLEGFLINDKTTFFWAFFPLSWSGIKVALLFISVIPVLILRIGQLSVTPRLGISPYQKILKSTVSISLPKTIGSYILSAWLYVQLYLWTFTVGDDLGVVTRQANYERYRLNERYLYLSFFAIHAGLLYGACHLAFDLDYLTFSSIDQPALERFKTQLWPSTDRVLRLALVATLTAPVMYVIFRSLIWKISIAFVGTFTKLHKDASLPSYPFSLDLFFRTLWLAVLILGIWEIANNLFSIFFSQDPVHDGVTVSEKSPDPNGSLVWGLKMKKKPLTQVMAFMELSYIADKSPGRRTAIFKDLRQPTTIWQQILHECLSTIHSIPTSLDGTVSPSQPAPSPQASLSSASIISATPLSSQRTGYTSSPILEDNIFLSPPKKSPAHAWQTSPDQLPKSPISLKGIVDTTKTIIKNEKLDEKVNTYIDTVIRSPYGGALFRTTIQAKTLSLLPSIRMQSDAIRSLSYLVIASLKEDEFGSVQKDLPTILAELCDALNVLKKYKANPPLHWTDVEAIANKEGIVLDGVNVLINVLTSSLQDIGTSFAPYLRDINLSSSVRATLKDVKMSI